MWVTRGNPYADDATAYSVIRSARESKQPFFATCSGFQYTAVEFARNVAGIHNAAHAEESPDADNAVVDALECSLVGQEREVTVAPGTRLAEICGTEPVTGFEAIEYADHPFFIAMLFHPQVGASAGRELHPLIAAFAQAAG